MKNIVKDLTEGMQRLCAIANRIVSHDGSVGQIEKDLLLEDLRRLYDVALRLNEVPAAEPAGAPEGTAPAPMPKMPDDEILSSTVMATMAAMSVPETAQEPAPVAAPVAPEPVAEPVEPKVVEMPRMEDLEANGNSLLFDEVIIEPEPAPAVEPEPVPEPEPAPVPEPEPAPVPEPEPATAPDPEPASEPEAKAGTQASLLDYLKHPVEEKTTVRTLGDSLGAKQETLQAASLHETLEKKVSDLRTVININDKFMFMSELFHNNMKAYNDFILRLNSIDIRDEALLYVNEVSVQNQWDENSIAVQSFYKVFNKKF